MHERDKRTTSGVRQRPHPQQLTPTSQTSLCNSGSSSALPLLSSSSTNIGASLRGHTGTKLLDALSHPTAVAAAVHGPPRRGRKRKAAFWVILTASCMGVVYYSSTMYDYDTIEISDRESSTRAQQTRRTRLRSRNGQKITMTIDLADPSDNNSQNDRAGSNLGPPPPLQGPGAVKRATPNKLLSHYDRMYHAMTSAFIADAASMGTHWIYNPEELRQQLLEDGGGEQALEHPEFLPQPPYPRFYSSQEFPGHYGRGQASPYGEALLFVAEYTASTVRNDKQQSPDDATAVENLSNSYYKWATSFGGRLDTATQAFVACRRDQADVAQQVLTPANAVGDDDAAASPAEEPQYCGAQDDQAHYFLKIIPVTCLYAGRPNRRSKVEQAIRVHQNQDSAVVYGLALSDLLEALLFLGEEANDDDAAGIVPVATLAEALDQVWQSIRRDQTDYVQQNEAWLPQLVGVGADQADMPLDNTQLFQAWQQAKDMAEQQPTLSLEQVAAKVGRSCHMPGALIVPLFVMYRTAALESSSVQSAMTATLVPTKKSPTTSMWRSYQYYVQALLGTNRDDENTLSPPDNPYMVQAIRDNIFAAGDTCSRAILIAALLGAAFGRFPSTWLDQMDPQLVAKMQAAARTIAQSATTTSSTISRTRSILRP